MQVTPIFHRVTRDQAEEAEGIVIVIDVIRAFTVAAYAFAGGATSLWLVRAVSEAHALRKHVPDALLAGEIGGRLIPGFDLNNSPHVMSQADIRGRRIIQRTGAGTQGAVGAHKATHLLATSLATARATARHAAYLSQTTGLPITFLPTESSRDNILRNEDKYCADYIEALITRPDSAGDVLRDRVERLHAEGRFAHWGQEKDEDFPQGDLEKILAADRLDFAMVGTIEHLVSEQAGLPPIRYVELRAVQPA